MKKWVGRIASVLALCALLAGCAEEPPQMPPSEGNIKTVASTPDQPAGPGEWVAIAVYNNNAPNGADMVFFRATEVVRGLPETQAGEETEYCLLKYELYFPQEFVPGYDDLIGSCHPFIEVKQVENGEPQRTTGQVGVNSTSWWPSGQIGPGGYFRGGAFAFSMRRGDTNYLLEVGMTADRGKFRELPKAFIRPEPGGPNGEQPASGYENYAGTEPPADAARESASTESRAMDGQNGQPSFSYQNITPVASTKESPAGLGDWVEFSAYTGLDNFTAMVRVTKLTRGIAGWRDGTEDMEYCMITYDICVPPEFALMDVDQTKACARSCSMTIWVHDGKLYSHHFKLIPLFYIAPYPDRQTCSPEGLIQGCTAVFPAPIGTDGYPLQLNELDGNSQYIYIPFV